MTLSHRLIIILIEIAQDDMITLAYLSGPDIVLLVVVALLFFPAFFVKRVLGGPLYGFGHLVGRLTGQASRTRKQVRGEAYGGDNDTDIELSPAFLEAKYKKVLGLTGKITAEDIKCRWRELSRQYHPDYVQHLGPKLRAVAEQEMKSINEAHQYLCKRYGI